MVSNSISFQDGTFDSYSLTVETDLIKIDCYLLGSPAGGTGTECSHTIKGEKIAEFFAATNLTSTDELRELAAKFSALE